jgi:lipoprotein-anchoring transpeptidase ErfK/SrfK
MRRLLAFIMICAVTATVDVAPATAAKTTTWAKVVIDLSEQHLEVFNSAGTSVRRWPISSGAHATPTPMGRFKVTSKSRSTFVTDNPAVTMQHMVRFNGNIGFHAIPKRNGVALYSPLGKKAVSHGCIRLAPAHARALFMNLAMNAPVIVQR